MTIAEGHFRLYTHVLPALKAGDYRFVGDQSLTAKDKDGDVGAGDLPVQELQTHVRVTSPRYLLPPDQVLSTYPPAGTEGAYGARLPQVVIKRRTLPWERAVDGGTDGTPWLALVVYAEGEADVIPNLPVAQCVTPGVRLDGPVDVEKASCLEIRSSMTARIMPTRKDVPLLAHAREVNIDDTEMMLGDDDGFLAVVIANRLPVAARNPDGSESPLTYHAVLISLEGPGQFTSLLEKSPPAKKQTDHIVLSTTTAVYGAAEYDHMVMGSPYTDGGVGGVGGVRGGGGPHAAAPEAEGTTTSGYRVVVAPDGVMKANSGTGGWVKVAETGYVDNLALAAGTGVTGSGIVEALDPKLRFPALLHWTFTTTGETTFELLMRESDSGLLGTVGRRPTVPAGRPPLEVVETGHVGLDHRTRRGDLVRAWYRGPLLPHPADLTSPRLLLAHTGDQLRTVIPDGREDLSLAAAFEIGRLLALSQPSMVASLVRWRQLGYQAARLNVLWAGILDGLDIAGVGLAAGRLLGTYLGRGLARTIATRPAETVGPPREILTPGTPMGLDGDAITLVTNGFGIDIATDLPMVDVLGALRSTEVPRAPLEDMTGATGAEIITGAFALVRDVTLGQLVSGALSTEVMTRPGSGPALPSGIFAGMPVVHAEDRLPPGEAPDALDDALSGRHDHEEEDA